LRALRARGILAGLDLGRDFPGIGVALLVCATETKSKADFQRYFDSLKKFVGSR
jgi:glycine dehydrogenase subunit 1